MNDKLKKDFSPTRSIDEKNRRNSMIESNLISRNDLLMKNQFELINNKNYPQINDDNNNTLSILNNGFLAFRSFSIDFNRKQQKNKLNNTISLNKNLHEQKGMVNYRVIKLYSLSPTKDVKTRNSSEQQFKANTNTKLQNTKLKMEHSNNGNNTIHINSIVNRLSSNTTNISTKIHKKTKSHTSNSTNPINLNIFNPNDLNNFVNSQSNFFNNYSKQR